MPKLIEVQAAKGAEMTAEQAKIVLAFAKNDMQLRAAAEELYLTGATVAYHLDKIRTKTGRNPRKFFDLCFLVGAAEHILGGTHE
jgi:sugar diacid utilization regulator